VLVLHALLAVVFVLLTLSTKRLAEALAPGGPKCRAHARDTHLWWRGRVHQRVPVVGGRDAHWRKQLGWKLDGERRTRSERSKRRPARLRPPLARVCAV
jgi:hypothetical protein